MRTQAFIFENKRMQNSRNIVSIWQQPTVHFSGSLLDDLQQSVLVAHSQRCAMDHSCAWRTTNYLWRAASNLLEPQLRTVHLVTPWQRMFTQRVAQNRETLHEQHRQRAIKCNAAGRDDSALVQAKGYELPRSQYPHGTAPHLFRSKQLGKVCRL